MYEARLCRSEEIFEQEHEAARRFANEFEDAFKDAVFRYVGPNGRLVVFIDDLDRCIPESAVMVLESIKLFLDKGPCVFVIGADQSVIQHGIAQQYGADYSSRDYLAKIIQIPFTIPRVRTQVIDALWESARTAGPGFDDNVKNLASAVMPPNVRTWKRFLNAYTLATEIAAARKVPLAPAQDTARALVVIVALTYPGLYDLFTRYPDRAKTFVDLAGSGSANQLTPAGLAGNRLGDFARFGQDGDVIRFFQLCQRHISNAPALGGQEIDATRLQEAISCVPL